MLEIIAIIYLVKAINEVAKEKELKATGYVVVTIGMLIGFEIIGGMLGMILVGESLAAYPFALMGGGLGGYVGYSFVRSALPKSERD